MKVINDYAEPLDYAAAFTPNEELSDDDDNGTMPNNVGALALQVVGHRIVKVEERSVQLEHRWGGDEYDRDGLVLTLDTGKVVALFSGGDCCAYTELEAFLFNADKIDHIITGVRTEDGYTRWSIFADAGDVLALTVRWSCGDPFYYGYGFDIGVTEVAE